MKHKIIKYTIKCLSVPTVMFVMSIPWSVFLDFDCIVDDSMPQYCSDFLYIQNMLKYCMTDSTYNGKGEYYIGSIASTNKIIHDDGRLFYAFSSVQATEKKEQDYIRNLKYLVRYNVPYNDFAYVSICEGDIIECMVAPDLSPSYRRYFDLKKGKSQELYYLAVTIRNDSNTNM